MIVRFECRRMQALAPGGQTELDAATLEAIAEEAPSAQLPKVEIVGAPLANILMATKLQPSKSASKRLIQVLDLCWEDLYGPHQESDEVLIQM